MTEEMNDEGVPIKDSTQDAKEDSVRTTLTQVQRAGEKKRRFVVVILAIIALALIAVFSTFTVLGVKRLQQNPDFAVIF